MLRKLLSLFQRPLAETESKDRIVYPVPTHLKEYLNVNEDAYEKDLVCGDLRCTCGMDRFEIWHSNTKCIIKAICVSCRKEILIFDSDLHGWNGYICHDHFNDKYASFEKWECTRCNHNSWKVVIGIIPTNKEQFIEEAVNDSLGEFTEEDYPNAFDWFSMSLSCDFCDNTEKLEAIECS